MFRIKLVAGLALLVAVQAIFVTYALDNQLAPLAVEDSEIALQRSATLIEKSHRIDEYALKEKAHFVANRGSLRRAMTRDYEGDWEAERHRNVLRQLETENFRFTTTFSRQVQGLRNLDLTLLHRRPLTHDLFFALDETGRLAATLGTGRVHMMGDDIGSRFPATLEAIDGDEVVIDLWNWSWRPGDDRELYLVAMAPIADPDGDDNVGTVVLGNRITNSVAERRKELLTDGLGEEGDGEYTSRSRAQAPEVTFFRGERIHSSTLGSRQISELAETLFEDKELLASDTPERIHEIDLHGHPYRAMVRFFPGQFGTDNPAGVILLSDTGAAIAPYDDFRSQVIWLSAALFGIGLILILLFFHLFLSPFQRLEEGIQYVISGDKDHQFKAPSSHPSASNMASHLNLMSAYLQGKPMPDEDVDIGGWGPLDGANDADQESQEPTKVAGVPMNLGGGPSSSDASDSGDDGDDQDEDDSTDKPTKD